MAMGKGSVELVPASSASVFSPGDSTFESRSLLGNGADAAMGVCVFLEYRTKSWLYCYALFFCALAMMIILTISRDSVPQQTSDLEFQEVGKDGLWKFQILQIADIHLGEAEDSNWGPEQDRKTFAVMDKLFHFESPDLIVLSGDQLTANNCDENATEYYRLLGKHLSKYNIPWAMIFGNHDDADFEIPGMGRTQPAKTSRSDLLAVDQSFPMSRTRLGPPNLFGTTNYFLDIYLSNLPAARIYFFDSGGGQLKKEIQQSQLDWFKVQTSSGALPSVAFQHIPTTDFAYQNTCQGFRGEGVDPLDADDGILQTLNASGLVSFLAVGHNHGNDYCCPYSASFKVCFARHSGYGGYGSWERGARVYELTLHSNQQTKLEWTSWVRLESGEVIDDVNSLYR